jgi:hypothetical protein
MGLDTKFEFLEESERTDIFRSREAVDFFEGQVPAAMNHDGGRGFEAAAVTIIAFEKPEA